MKYKGEWHVGITVSDIDRSIKFYRDVLGLDHIDGPSEPRGGEIMSKGLGLVDGEVIIAKFKVGERQDSLELLMYTKPEPTAKGPFLANTPGTAHYAFHVEDVMEAKKELESRGVEFFSEPIIGGTQSAKSTAGWRWVYFRDPDGTMLELVDYDPTRV